MPQIGDTVRVLPDASGKYTKEYGDRLLPAGKIFKIDWISNGLTAECCGDNEVIEFIPVELVEVIAISKSVDAV